WAVGWVVTALIFILIERGLLKLTIARWIGKGYLARNIVIFGAGEQGERLIAKLRRSADKSIAIRGVFDDRKSRVPRVVCGCDVPGDANALLRFGRRVAVEEVIIALPLTAERRLKTVVEKLKLLPADVRISAEQIAENFPLRGISYMGGVPLLEIIDRPIKHWSAVAKWIEDKV